MNKIILPFFKTKSRTIITVLILIVVGFFLWQKVIGAKQQSQYQTSTVEKDTLISSITASGQITSANNVTITIQASGVVKEVYVKNEDAVTQGQKIAELTLDQLSQQKQASALSNYLSMQNSLNAAKAKMNSLQSALFKANQTFVNDKGIANPSDTQKLDPKYIEESADWLQAESDYKNQAAVISQAAAALNSAVLSLAQTSSTITAPVAGVVKGLTIAPGSIITLSNSGSLTTSLSQVLGSIYQTGAIQAQVNVSEIDSVKIKDGQKVTMTLDAFPDLTFTGKVASINTNGVVSSGVTTYPSVIYFDIRNDHVYPNMAVTAKIIVAIKNDVILIPTSAIQTANGQSSVRLLKNGKPVSVMAEVGDSNDTQTEIKSGVEVGDVVVIGVDAANARTQSGTSPFSPFGGGGLRPGGFGGGRGR